ncbi:hypothetical protein QFC24_005690 [Naganishia onofrii]|uniref:Uncharacterized protein n=1 Tax=Naganishia onofrii TaxID=1851511 RepID=A0ACC2X847_9TREE|nr:hypothetical protein QFC24_005690 [Naganishia onofrii]
MSSSSAAPVQPASAIPPDLLSDLSESPTAGADIHEIVQSPDMMSEGAFPSRPGSADGFGFTGEGRWNDTKLMHPKEDRMVGEVVSPFPLQGPIRLDVLSTSTDTSATTPSPASPFDAQLDTPVAPNPAGSVLARFPSVRKAPDSPSQSPSVSRRTSSQEVPSSTSQQHQQHTTLSPADTDSSVPTAADETIEHRTSNLAMTDSVGIGNGSGYAVSSSNGVPGGRTRRPSTLIPQPGKEEETIPPRYRAEDTVVKMEKGDVKAESDEKVLDTSTTATDTDTPNESLKTIGHGTSTISTSASDTTHDNSEENTTTTPPVREPRVVVRDFGFPSHDPRYRGAFHPIPGEAEDNGSDEEEDEDDARSTASGASSGWNRFTTGAGRVRRKSSLGGGVGGWSGFGFGGFGAAVVRRFSKSSAASGSGRRGSVAGMSTAGSTTSASEAQQENGAGSRRGSAVPSVKSPGPIVLPTPLPRDTDVDMDTDVPTSLSDLTPTPSSVADDDEVGGSAQGGSAREYAFGSGSIPGGGQAGEEGARLSILSQVSEEGGFPQSDSSEDEGTSKWPDSSTTGNTNNSTSTSGTGTTVTAREPRGRYKVLYEFVAEGDHEMSVREGEVLIVGGRWGSMGWVIAERVEGGGEETQRKGLVPEGYLGERIG